MRAESLNVLIADDQAGLRYLLDIVAREAGYSVYTARNGLEAVDQVRSHHPDLVFLDVRMPLMGGLEALDIIKEIAPETEVIVMTAFCNDETVRQAMLKGAMCFIAKPFDVDEVKQLLLDFRWRGSLGQASGAEG